MSVLEVSAEQYHAGVDDTPRLSASIAHTLWAKTPLHAWTEHPRLNPNYTPKVEDKFELGTVVHALLLEGQDSIYVVHSDDWRTKASKEEREYARSLGKIALLARHRDEVYAMRDAVQEKLAELPETIFTDGKPEVSLIWSEGDVDFKARLDWLEDDCSRIVDLKTSSQPTAFERRLFDYGYDIKAAMYRRAVSTVFGPVPDFVWVVIETSEPYEIRLIRPGADVLAAGERKLEWAIGQWRACMATGSWPGYPREIIEAELPSWEEARLLAREAA